MIGMAAFWFDQSKSLIHLKWMSEGIFGGAWLPLYFFPQWLQIFASLPHSIIGSSFLLNWC